MLTMSDATFVDYYAVLGVNVDASADEIKKAHGLQTLRHHPNNHGQTQEAHDNFTRIGAAWGILGNKDSRETYNVIYHHHSRGSPGAYAATTPVDMVDREPTQDPSDGTYDPEVCEADFVGSDEEPDDFIHGVKTYDLGNPFFRGSEEYAAYPKKQQFLSVPIRLVDSPGPGASHGLLASDDGSWSHVSGDETSQSKEEMVHGKSFSDAANDVENCMGDCNLLHERLKQLATQTRTCMDLHCTDHDLRAMGSVEPILAPRLERAHRAICWTRCVSKSLWDVLKSGHRAEDWYEKDEKSVAVVGCILRNARRIDRMVELLSNLEDLLEKLEGAEGEGEGEGEIVGVFKSMMCELEGWATVIAMV